MYRSNEGSNKTGEWPGWPRGRPPWREGTFISVLSPGLGAEPRPGRRAPARVLPMWPETAISCSDTLKETDTITDTATATATHTHTHTDTHTDTQEDSHLWGFVYGTFVCTTTTTTTDCPSRTSLQGRGR